MHPPVTRRRALLTSLASRLWRKSDPDYHQALARAVIVAGALWFAFSSYYAEHAPSELAVLLGKWAALVSAVITALTLFSILRWPGESVARRVIAITYDICTNAFVLYVGGEATAFFTVIFLVIILASGVRFGVAYMGYAAVCSLAAFGVMLAASPYWSANHVLTVNTVLVLTVVPAYMYRLIRFRQDARVDLERRATHDSLTGLMNRAGFEQQLQERFAPDAPEHVLIYLDLDRFKLVNDAAGHAAGDKLLVEVAGIVRECVRDADVCARIGGDEFCVFLGNCSLGLGKQIATRIKDRTHTYRLSWSGKQYAVGASIGVVSSRSVENGTSFLRVADAACYAAKNSGRNTVHVVDPAGTRADTGEIRALNVGD